ncbi:alpha/beta fold hydrolase [Glaciibacter superstes]|uniref:alpha/beta fold hydrolase n=1 Tax=Glaciibacter superstes TaxID=501023 RepID=UPI0003B59A27|nr:alpha/beta hydrolase [Glaciibacter superstes]
MNDPLVVLVHGAFAESASWGPVIERLHSKSVRVMAVGNPLRSLSTDAQYLADAINNADGPAVLVGHSYGGMVITQAATGLPSVAALVYVGGFAPDTGESALILGAHSPGSTLGDTLETYPLSSGGNELRIAADLFPRQFCADVPIETARVMALTQRPVTQAALADTLSAEIPAWKTKPSWFVFGSKDLNIPAETQKFMAGRAAATATFEVDGASHALNMSRPDEVASTVLDAVEWSR